MLHAEPDQKIALYRRDADCANFTSWYTLGSQKTNLQKMALLRGPSDMEEDSLGCVVA
jgi:hypothetical protein